MTLMFVAIYAALLVVDLLLALVAVARVLPVDRRTGGVLLLVSLSAALTIIGVTLTELGAFTALTLRTSQTPPSTQLLLGYGFGALLALQVPPLAHAGAMAAAGFALLSMTGSDPEPEQASA